MKKAQPSIVDIAKELHVSPSTVSRAFTCPEKVKPETREKILEVAEKLKYTPSKLARKLVKKEKTLSLVGVAMPQIVQPFFFELLKGIQEFLHKYGKHMVVFQLEEEKEKVYQFISEEILDGLIILGDIPSQQAKKRFHQHTLPYLLLDIYDEESNCVYVNNMLGGKLASQYLVSQGAKKLAMIGNIDATIHQIERMNGFKRGVEEEGVELVYTVMTEVSEKGGYEMTKKLLREKEVDGIFYFCDTMAYGGLKALRELGIKKAIVGYDDLPMSSWVGLSTIRQPAFEMGKRSVEILIDYICKITFEKSSPIHVCYDPLLISRQILW